MWNYAAATAASRSGGRRSCDGDDRDPSPPPSSHQHQHQHDNIHTSLLNRNRGIYSENSYTVSYDSKNTLSVLFQKWGSVWPKVLPYCIWNCCIDIALQLLRYYDIIDLSVSCIYIHILQ